LATNVLERVTTDTTSLSFIERNFPDGPGMKIVTITPTDAEDLLLTNEENRPVSKVKVEQYAGDITAGKWAMNGETIKVSREGYLNDGQHRLEAVIMAGKPIVTAFIFGVERDTRLTVDQGRARGTACYLGLKGVTNSAQIAAVARLAYQFEQSKGLNFGKRSPSPTATMDYIDQHHDELQEASRYTNKAAWSSRNIASKTLFTLWAFLLRNNPKGIEYLDQVMTGIGIPSIDAPAHRVREKLTNLSRISRVASTEAFLRGWVYFRDGKTMSHVKLTGEFPKI
jgi:hypothetical protein